MSSLPDEPNPDGTRNVPASGRLEVGQDVLYRAAPYAPAHAATVVAQEGDRVLVRFVAVDIAQWFDAETGWGEPTARGFARVMTAEGWAAYLHKPDPLSASTAPTRV